MGIVSVVTLFGGLAFFLYGMNVMSSGLEKLTGGRLELLLKKMTSNMLLSLALGAGITIAIQSSSALTVMLVGLVNSGIMELEQTIGVIMGSNIGTTLTAWLLSLTGIESDNIILTLVKPETFSPVAAFAGIMMIMTSKSGKKKSLGSILVGFSILMYGMELMKDAMSPLAGLPEFYEILTAFNNPILGVLTGAIVTGVIQSSAASVGILQALSMTGGITYGMAIPIIMGQNIGTCVTAIISSFGVNKSAKRVSVVHISFNIIGTVVCLTAFYGLNAVFKFSITNEVINPAAIAAVHSIFNIVTTIILLPFTKLLKKIALFVVRSDTSEEKFTFIDERLINTPSVAVGECRIKVVEMSELGEKCVDMALNMLLTGDVSEAEKVKKYENALDEYEDKLGTMLVRLSSKALSSADSAEISCQLHSIGDFERIGDHALALSKSSLELKEKKLGFSGEAQRELEVLISAINEVVDLTTRAYEAKSAEKAALVEPLEQVVDGIIADIKTRHIERLRSGESTIELGFVLSDILNNLSRISDHCSNVAVAIIETQNSAFNTHEYLHTVKYAGDRAFEERYRTYSRKYAI